MQPIQTLRKWGNGTGVRLPKDILDAAQLKPDQQIWIQVRKGEVVLTPIVEDRRSKLEKMFEGVTPSMVGGELDWGSDLGAEAYE